MSGFGYDLNKTGFRGELQYKIFLDRYASKDIGKSIKEGDLVIQLVDPIKGQRELARVLSVSGDKAVIHYLTGFLTENGIGTSLVGIEKTVTVESIDKPLELTSDELAGRVSKALAKASQENNYPQGWAYETAQSRGLLADAKASSLKEQQQQAEEAIYKEIIANWQFVPAGRILSGAGVDHTLTLFNCYVIASPRDSRKGINTTLGLMTEIMSRGGGVGINISSLRYRGAYVKGVNGRSSGAVSWGEEYSRRTGKVEQGGSRRGALMIMLCDWHPDLMEFIQCKQDGSFATNCNISVAWSDAFMQKVIKLHETGEDSDWDLKFPDFSHPSYDESWTGILEHWVAAGKPVKVVQTLKVSEIWNKYVGTNWSSAEPGSLFVDRVNYWSNSQYYPQGYLQCTNPCGEQPISAGLELESGSVCNLGHINLSKFGPSSFTQPTSSDVERQVVEVCSYVNWEELEHTVYSAIHFMDNIYESTKPVNADIAKQSFSERRIGLGTLGLAELLIRLGITYGDNPLCLLFLDELYFKIAFWAYKTSVELAKERGAFPYCEPEKHAELPFIREIQKGIDARGLNYDLVGEIRKYGIRNVTLITQAPTGSVGSLNATSTGIEPYPFLTWVRKSRIGEYTEYALVAQEYYEAKGLDPQKDKLPPYFVTAADPETAIAPRDHSATQSVIQRWTDSSISKTCNLPSDFTEKDVSAFYLSLYKSGAKGGTVYRDKSRNEQVLMSTTDSRVTKMDTDSPILTIEDDEEDRLDTIPILNIPNIPGSFEPMEPMPLYREADSEIGRKAWTTHLETPVGRLFVNISFLRNEPFELFVFVGKGGSEVYANCEAIGRLCSMFLQVSSYAKPGNKLIKLRDHLRNIGGSDQIGFGPKKVRSLPDGIGRALDIFLQQYPEGVLEGEEAGEMPVALQQQHNKPTVRAPSKVMRDICPQCGSAALEHAAGCTSCQSCGYSKC